MNERFRSEVGVSAALVVALLACKSLSQDEAEDAAGSAANTAPAPSAAKGAPVEASATPALAASAVSEAKAEAAEAEGDAIPAIPAGRSKPPTVQEWSAADEVNTQEVNSQPDACFMKIVREWLKVNCGGDVLGFSEMAGFGRENSDYFSSVREGKSIDFVVRLRKGKTMKLRIHRGPDDSDAAVFVNWPQKADKPTIVALGRAKKAKLPAQR